MYKYSMKCLAKLYNKEVSSVIVQESAHKLDFKC